MVFCFLCKFAIMLPAVTKNHPFIWTGIFFLIPTLLFAQKELKNYERVRYADVGYAKLGFGEVNQRLLTEKQVAKLNRHIERIQAEYGAVVIFGSLIPEEVVEWESGNLSGLPRHYLGEDPHAARNHVMILFDDEDGQNWIRYGCDNAPDFEPHTEKLSRLFAAVYRIPKAYRPIRRVLKQIDRIYARLSTERQATLRNPLLSAKEWADLAWAEMDIARDYVAAIQHLETAVTLDTAGTSLKLLGYANLERQDWDAAATALTTAWSLSADFETAVGMLTLHYLRHEPSAIAKWAEQVRRFTLEFEETIYASAHYENEGFFLTNSARMAFHDVFQHKIQQSKLLEAMPEAEAY